MDPESTNKASRLLQTLTGLVAPKAEQEIREERHQAQATGATSIAEARQAAEREEGGSVTTVCGVFKAVSLRPRAGVPAVEADLFDGSGHLRVIFLGRRSIAGVEPGRRLIATGRINCHDGQWTMYNPRYQLLPATKGN